ncbi:unnamed protein product [Calypogeia fissa]
MQQGHELQDITAVRKLPLGIIPPLSADFYAGSVLSSVRHASALIIRDFEQIKTAGHGIHNNRKGRRIDTPESKHSSKQADISEAYRKAAVAAVKFIETGPHWKSR